MSQYRRCIRAALRLASGLLMCALLAGCAQINIGKVRLSEGNVPENLIVGKTTERDVISSIGEPLGYREIGGRSAMIYVHYEESYTFYLVGEVRWSKAHRLDLVFNNGVLEKTEVKKEGWGFGLNVDPQLLQILAN